MAKFIKPVNLWEVDTIEAIKSGELVLQVGQWVKCGSGELSRFIAYKPHSDTFDCVHYPTAKKFRICALFSRMSNGDFTNKQRKELSIAYNSNKSMNTLKAMVNQFENLNKGN